MKTHIFLVALGLVAAVPAVSVLACEGQQGDRKQARFDRIDADKDGRVTLAEFIAGGNRMFQHLDANGDGSIGKDELGDGERGGRMFERMDTDRDGTVTSAEFEAGQNKLFAMLDQNGDGSLNQGEMQSGPKGQGKGEGPQGGAN